MDHSTSQTRLVIARVLKELYPLNPDVVLGREARVITQALFDVGLIVSSVVPGDAGVVPDAPEEEWGQYGHDSDVDPTADSHAQIVPVFGKWTHYHPYDDPADCTIVTSICGGKQPTAGAVVTETADTQTLRVVWKFPLVAASVTSIDVPEGGIVRHVDQQDDCPTIWIEVDPKQPTERWTIKIVGTGHQLIDHTDEFLGTVLIFEGQLVWHVYRRHS